MADHSSSSSSLQKKPINTIEHKDTLGNDRDHKEALNSDNDNTSGLKINGVPIEDARGSALTRLLVEAILQIVRFMFCNISVCYYARL